MRNKELLDFALQVFYSEELRPFFNRVGADEKAAVTEAVKRILKDKKL